MTADEARERFDDALDGELDATEQAAFEQALAQDAALRDDYEAHCSTRDALRSLGSSLDGSPGPSDSVDLLPDLQARLRRQSGGKYYRDRFSQKQGTRGSSLLLAAVAGLLLIAVLWLANEAGLLLPDTPQ